MQSRDIDDILHFRSDISPFLVHLTRTTEEQSASDALTTIIDERQLKCSFEKISDVRFAFDVNRIDEIVHEGFLSAICFTETPLNEIHCLLEIAYRQVKLEPYGLVFLKSRLETMGVSPVLYINNKQGTKFPIFEALASLADSHREAALEILPLVALYGKKIQGVGATTTPLGKNEFMWEREWRYPYINGNLPFSEDDIFIGLCPHEKIDQFEALLPGIEFVDPQRNVKWYAKKLIDARKRLDLKASVI